MLKYWLLIALLTVTLSSFAQEKKQLQATRISTAPKIDGVLDEAVWESLTAYGNFMMYEPGNEGTVDTAYQTQVKFAYDDKAVYVAAYMFDPNPSEILSQFSQRDDVFVQADHFSIALNTYNDGINETHFFVTSAGTIGDARATSNNFDFGYNVVFECKISKDSKGWYAEYKIPYNALRFPEVDIQDWSVNFYRKLIHKNETHTWNRIDRTVGREALYSGEITGIENIDPPIRLTLFPFAQGVVTSFDGETDTDFSAGMDIKYGLTDSFTLDATLIPDFGQAAFDKVTLNLGPFEQTFDEQRPFFTEGIDLFRKGRIFFSRRVGGAPSGDVDDLSSSEIITESPQRVNLLNALKISGRTEGQLGIGFFNAITEKTYASVKDTVSGNSREVLVEPLSNYNIFVLDQQFNGNSSISIINTNVTREGGFRDANTSALVFDVADKGNRFRVGGRAIMSHVRADGNSTGFLSELDLVRVKGNFRYRIGHDFSNTTYDINDLGVNFRNNFNNFVAGASYQIFEPNETFNTYRIGVTARHKRLYDPDVTTGNTYSFDSFFVLPTRFAFGMFSNFNTDEDDYFEPRVPGKYVTRYQNLGGRAWISSDYRKKFAVDLGVGYRTYFDDPQQNYQLDFSPRYRFSDKLLLIFRSDIFFGLKNFGYVANTETDVFFGQRDIKNIENAISASYNFDPYKAIDLRFRNFWSSVDYSSDSTFFSLNDDGTRSIVDYDTSENNPNQNFNIWNLDLSFRWRFAPGSEATLLYRNQIFNQDNLSRIGYTESLSNLFKQEQQNTVSLRITYFIDYNDVNYLFNKQS